jgi:putative effector of murein hydrolase
MKKLLPEFEHRTQPVIPPEQFIVRLARSGFVALVFIVISLLAGMIGYHTYEGLSWIDAFLNAAMLLGGMGPVNSPITDGGKLFAGIYALYCGLAVIFVAGIILAPIAHRILHRFHVDDRDA